MQDLHTKPFGQTSNKQSSSCGYCGGSGSLQTKSASGDVVQVQCNCQRGKPNTQEIFSSGLQTK